MSDDEFVSRLAEATTRLSVLLAERSAAPPSIEISVDSRTYAAIRALRPNGFVNFQRAAQSQQMEVVVAGTRFTEMTTPHP